MDFLVRVCRFCGGSTNLSNGLCALDDADLMIHAKVEKVFKIKLFDESNNNNICFDCIIKLENSLSFLEMIEKTQAMMMNRVVHLDCVRNKETSAISPQATENEVTEQQTNITKKNRLRTDNRWNGNNPVLRIEDIFLKELTQGIFETKPEELNVKDSEKNGDGTLNEAGEHEVLERGWCSYIWKCVECNANFFSSHSLEEHFKAAHRNKKITYACQDCPASFKSFFSFQNHVIDSHRYYMKFFCDICPENRWFYCLTSLFRHRQQFHPKIKNTCLYCGRIFECGFYLKQHVIIHRKIEKSDLYHCDLCDFNTHTKHLMRQHFASNHVKNDSEHICEQCGKIVKRLSDMRSHQLVHTTLRPYGCDICELKFKCIKQLRCHKKLHYPRLYSEQCSVCEKKFPTKSKLTRHFRIHQNVFSYTCEFCGRKFKHASGFATHRRIHTGERPYSCQKCERKFIDWPNMNKHFKRCGGE